MTLVLGPSGVGKTLLLKRLSAPGKRSLEQVDGEKFPTSVPTVGTNLVNVDCGRKGEVVVRELGGAMAPIWKNYYRDSKAIVFMADLSNKCQISVSCIQFLTILKEENLQNVSILLLLNKCDMASSMTKENFMNLLRFSDIEKFAKQKLTVFEISAKCGTGLNKVAKWLQQNAT